MINCFCRASFIEGEEFWCSECDNAVVHSDKPETGTFYQVFGHQHIYGTQPGHNDYHSIIFALCTRCDKLKDIVENDENTPKRYGIDADLNQGGSK